MTTGIKPGHVTIVIGGQYGSEGKGEVTPFITRQTGARHVVRTGGPNAGHTFTNEYGTFKMRQIPAPWLEDVSPDDRVRPPILYIAAGSLIKPDVLFDELRMVLRTCTEHDRPLPTILIDRSALIIEESHAQEEQAMLMRENIGSTTEGIGAARASLVMRDPVMFAADWWQKFGEYQFYDDSALSKSDWSAPGTEYPPRTDGPPVEFGPQLAFVDVSKELETAIHEFGEDVIIESTQGFALSLVHSGCYPFATSRDVTPGIIMNDAGLSSREDHSVIAVCRTMPIRVAGNSGPLHEETTWQDLKETIPHLEGPELTTVTRLPRRIGAAPDPAMMEKMVRLCRPDAFCLTFLDYVLPGLHMSDDHQFVKRTAYDYVSTFEEKYGVPVRWVSTGPGCIINW